MAKEGFVNIHGKERKWTVTTAGYAIIVNTEGRNSKSKYVHQLIVETALNRKLKGSEEIHHIDGNRLNNANSNLVVCPSREYHMMLHRRQRAFDATGNANSILCEYCGKHDAEKERKNRPQIGWHYECKRIYERNSYKNRKANHV